MKYAEMGLEELQRTLIFKTKHELVAIVSQTLADCEIEKCKLANEVKAADARSIVEFKEYSKEINKVCAVRDELVGELSHMRCVVRKKIVLMNNLMAEMLTRKMDI